VKAKNSDELALYARTILEGQKKVDPRVRFTKMVESGLIDKEGRVTREYGGDAVPDPAAREKVARAR
jgi:hypothetical protein